MFINNLSEDELKATQIMKMYPLGCESGLMFNGKKYLPACEHCGGFKIKKLNGLCEVKNEKYFFACKDCRLLVKRIARLKR